MVSNDQIPVITSETLQYRLDTQNFGKTVGQRGSLTRCAQKYGNFRVSLSSETKDAEMIEKSKDDLVREVELFDLELTKLILCHQNLERQVERNQIAEAERERKIQEAKDGVKENRDLANKAFKRKNCISEYESLTRVIHENHPKPSEELQKQIEGIRNDLLKREGEIASMDEILSVREAQYQLLIQYMMDLKRTLNEDDETGESEGTKESSSKGSINEPEPMEVDELYKDL